MEPICKPSKLALHVYVNATSCVGNKDLSIIDLFGSSSLTDTD
jgi:hypothetical protein